MDRDIITKARDGDSFAQLDLGKMYYNAYFMEDNCAFAFKWISLSAEQGNMEAQFRLGNLYALGQGIKQSHTYAYEWYTKSALQGYSKALVRVHNLYEDDKFMQCQGYQDKIEQRQFINYSLNRGKARDPREYRIAQSNLVLNKSMEYYHQTFFDYKKQDILDESALKNVGFMYQHGYGVKKNIKQAIKHYTAAAEKNVIDAQYNLGNLYQQHQDIKDNDKMAFMWYSKAAENGSIVAQNCLGFLYEKGIGVENDNVKALYWYTQAANKRCSSAQINLARIYRTGQSVVQDYNKAMMWYSLAATEGSLVAQNCLDQLCSIEEITNKSEIIFTLDRYKDPIERRRIRSLLRKHISLVETENTEKALKKLAMNAMRGDINAMYEISIKYRDGIDLPQDGDLSFKWLKKSAKGGSLIAQYKLGRAYYDGDLIVQNYHKSSIWFKSGNTQKDDKIQCELGKMYFYGVGVRYDELEASKWFTKSAEKNNSDAQRYLGISRLNGHGIRQNKTEALEWLIMSAKQRNRLAAYQIGEYYSGGTHIEKDFVKAIMWYTRAAKYGSPHAQSKLIDLYDDHKDLMTNITCLKSLLDEIEVATAETFLINRLLMCCIKGKIVDQDYIKAFNLVKKAKTQARDNLIDLFTVPINTNSDIDCGSLLSMYSSLIQNGIEELEYIFGYVHEFGIRDEFTYEIAFEPRASDFIKWYITASEKGVPQAQYRLGVIYEKGKEIEKNPVAAADFYIKAAEKGIPDAMFRLACLYLKGCGVSQDLEKAYNLFTQSHNMGQHHSFRFLKIPRDLTKNKIKVPPDEYEENEIEYESNKEEYDVLSMEMFETVAYKGNIAVQYKLGCLYSNTKSTDYNYSKAVYWLNLASQQRIPDACYRLGVLYEDGVEKNYFEAKVLYQKAAEKNHDEALYRLAQLYFYGKGVSVDYQKAFDLYNEAAKQENVRAQKIMDLLKTQHDNYVEKRNEKECVQATIEFNEFLPMFEYVANNENVDLQFKLGCAYENINFGQDYSESVKWYSMAMNHSHTEATYRLGILYEHGLGVIQSYERAIELYNTAEEKGCVKAAYHLGSMYHSGFGVKKDLEMAFLYYTKASKQGDSDAQYELATMYISEDGEAKNTLKALEWYTKSYLKGHDKAQNPLYLMYDDDTGYDFFFHNKLATILLKYANSRSNYLYVDRYVNSDMYSKLGEMYLLCHGVQKSNSEAWYFLKTAIELDLKYFPWKLSEQTRSVIKRNASELYEIAIKESENGDSYAHILVGLMHLGGIRAIARRDDNKRLKYSSIFGGYLDLDDNGPCENYGSTVNIIVRRDFGKAYTYFLKAADDGNIYSKVVIGQMYHCGYGVKQDFAKALDYYQSVPKNFLGFAYFSESFIHLLHLFGDGVKQDYKKAIEYLTKRPTTYDCYNMAQIYYYGDGVKQDYKASVNLLLSDSHTSCYGNLQLIRKFNESEPNENNVSQQHKYSIVSYYTLQGRIEYQLGIMHEKGQGVITDYREAFKRFSKSANYGNKEAQKHIDLYYKNELFIGKN